MLALTSGTWRRAPFSITGTYTTFASRELDQAVVPMCLDSAPSFGSSACGKRSRHGGWP